VEEKEVVRKILSLVVLVSAFTLVVTNGCGNTDLSEEGKVMTGNLNTIPVDNVTEGYKTATFALG
jgi:hypothetical protein